MLFVMRSAKAQENNNQSADERRRKSEEKEQRHAEDKVKRENKWSMVRDAVGDKTHRFKD